ncbi:hypothetical protein [Polynucleobacter sp. AP-RePozz3-80-G7]|uniref:hypothetical protein n=1 Tax=Polynucleobacter sp. AP-RePozz3-80-G7 TaxID=2689105 RepID=UPI001C0CEA30|nr:hypothetical protein [Polynucleobacter sp. AP-RePozz3-80-G7]MBU3638753.1 hypothetical protein [Polynucleobacter sp. AP-RePozz3-80-G7]
MKRLLPITLYLSIANASSMPFDKTGLIDLKNEGTRRGSCISISTGADLASNMLVLVTTQMSVKTNQAKWQKEKDIQKYTQLGKLSEYFSDALVRNEAADIPPNQMEDYTKARLNPKPMELASKNPQLVLDAFDQCLKGYNINKERFVRY